MLHRNRFFDWFQEPDRVEPTTAFLEGLTKLSRRTGVAIAGSPELFLMEPEDKARNYQIDSDSRLKFS